MLVNKDRLREYKDSLRGTADLGSQRLVGDSILALENSKSAGMGFLVAAGIYDLVKDKPVAVKLVGMVVAGGIAALSAEDLRGAIRENRTARGQRKLLQQEYDSREEARGNVYYMHGGSKFVTAHNGEPLVLDGKVLKPDQMWGNGSDAFIRTEDGQSSFQLARAVGARGVHAAEVSHRRSMDEAGRRNTIFGVDVVGWIEEVMGREEPLFPATEYPLRSV